MDLEYLHTPNTMHICIALNRNRNVEFREQEPENKTGTRSRKATHTPIITPTPITTYIGGTRQNVNDM